MMLACEHGNANLKALSIFMSRYPTIIKGTYAINTYNIDIYNVDALYLRRFL